MVLTFAWPPVRHGEGCPRTLAGEMDLREGRVFDWKGVRVSLLVEDEVNVCDFFVVLINRACFGDKRLKASERERGWGIHSDLLQAASLKENQQPL